MMVAPVLADLVSRLTSFSCQLDCWVDEVGTYVGVLSSAVSLLAVFFKVHLLSFGFLSQVASSKRSAEPRPP